MNRDLLRLQAYPFEKLNQLKAGISPPQEKSPIFLSMGEPKHAAPDFVLNALKNALTDVAFYPATLGLPALRQTMAAWLEKRFALPAGSIQPEKNILPVNGTREALFSFTQARVDRETASTGKKPWVIMPNPFYQIYEGAAFLAGATPYYMDSQGTQPDFDAIDALTWSQCQILFLCTPNNPTGSTIPLDTLKKLIQLAETHDFIIASDECYSEIYLDEDLPPAGLLQACIALGNTDYSRCVVFHSLSKRSNLPGLRSGFVAGDAKVLSEFLLYRTYHGCAMPVHHQKASLTAWQDETHVIANRARYREKFEQFQTICGQTLPLQLPQGGFYFWAETPIDDIVFTQKLFAEENVTVLPGQYLSRYNRGRNPGQNHVRMALVASAEECAEAAQRITQFVERL